MNELIVTKLNKINEVLKKNNVILTEEQLLKMWDELVDSAMEWKNKGEETDENEECSAEALYNIDNGKNGRYNIVFNITIKGEFYKYKKPLEETLISIPYICVFSDKCNGCTPLFEEEIGF